jgi:hypothetical protein
MIWSAILFGFFSVFGWNSGQKVWDKYIEPKFETSAEQAKDTEKK